MCYRESRRDTQGATLDFGPTRRPSGPYAWGPSPRPEARPKAIDRFRQTTRACAAGSQIRPSFCGTGRNAVVSTELPLATCSRLPLGWLFNKVRLRSKRDQDLVGERNKAMVDSLAATYPSAAGAPLLHAAGHDHSLQVLDGDGYGVDYLVVSGRLRSRRRSTRARRASRHERRGS